jgi:hypothetical protein
VPGTAIDDIRSLDPVSYIRSVGLRPEDSYGFVPVKVEEGAELLYLYRDRPEYEQARPKLAGSIESPTTKLGPVVVEAPQRVEIEAPADTPLTAGGIGDLIEQAQQLQQAWGGAQQAPAGAPGDQLKVPDPERLVRLAKLRESGAITTEEYQRMVAEETQVEDSPASEKAAAAPEGAAAIVAQRIYPGVRMRSSLSQLNRFLPIYCETVGIGPEDTYGVFPWGTRTSAGGDAGVGQTEWDDFWIIYRDRSEYAAGREAYAKEMDKKGRWPEPVTSPGIEEAPASGPGPGKIKVEKEGWPRKALVVKEKGPELGESLREKISKFGYEPEDSFGFCPNFEGNRIYFAWRKG